MSEEEKQVLVSPIEVPDLARNLADDAEGREINFIKNIPVTISVELGRIQMSVEDVLHLSPGSLVVLKRQTSEPIDLYVNEKLVGHGEIVAVDDYFGVRITDIINEAGESVLLSK